MPEERRHLDQIEMGIRYDDARFARGLREGVPRLPREFRRRRLAVVLLVLAVLVLALAGWLMARGIAAGILVSWPALAVAGYALRGPWRLKDHTR